MKIVELFCGIGGMHAALQEAVSSVMVVDAYEINPVALSIYKHNYPSAIKVKEKNIMGLSVKEFENFSADVLTMSPPCQPFTRQGLKKDIKDNRCSPLLHILSILEEAANLPNFILLENVAGFEVSVAHSKLIDVLEKKKFYYQEFLLTPSQFGIPNSRLRYYLIAKLAPKQFCFEVLTEISKNFPICLCMSSDFDTDTIIQDSNALCSLCSKLKIPKISLVLQNYLRKKLAADPSALNTPPVAIKNIQLPLSYLLEKNPPESLLLRQKDLIKYATVFDIVHADDSRSCCFTKGYGHYVKGTGSVITHQSKSYLDNIYRELQTISTDSPKYLEMLLTLKLRYFSPKEILQLMCFPDDFELPPNCSHGQAYKVIGNSVNVMVVTLLMLILFE